VTVTDERERDLRKLVVSNSLTLDGVMQAAGVLVRPPRLVLGTGQRMFTEGVPGTKLRLVDVTPTTTGVLVATYQPAGR
jgi:hypothetical protein